MKSKLVHFIKTKPVFALLLCLFFVLHGFTANYDFIPFRDGLLLTGLYVLVTLFITALSQLFYKHLIKASLLAFCIMGFHFFFGAAHDELKILFDDALVTRYSFILPATLIIFLLILIILKKTRRPLLRLNYFLNSLIFLLVLIESGWLISKIAGNSHKVASSLPEEFIPVHDVSKPDIYLIVADEYPGNVELKEVFSFDNAVFEASLKQRGFHTIPYSRSNYNYTPFAGASLLNMGYLHLENKDRGQTDLAFCYKTIRNNKLFHFLQLHDYRFYNYSVFDFNGQPARVNETFLPVKTRLITLQTFLSRLNRDIRFNLITKWKSKSELKKLTYSSLHNNNNIYELTWNNVKDGSPSPKFIYSHLMMPHYPYYFDENGTALPFERLVEGNQTNQKDFIGYLQYSNKKYLALIDHILQSSAKPPIIILMGDHGFRHFKQPVANDYYFLNHVSVYLPGQNYAAFSDSLTSVNLFRTILNTEFHQALPILKDSTIYLKD